MQLPLLGQSDGPQGNHVTELLPQHQPYTQTRLGAAYLGDSLELMRVLPDACVNLVVTSPPFALTFKKEYGNQSANDYVDWFLKFAREIYRALADDGSFVLDIGGAWNKGLPTRSLYHYRLILALCDEIGFHLAQDFFWFRPAVLPVPAEWVTVRRIRVKDAVNYVFWLGKTPWPRADNHSVLQPYSDDMYRLIRRGYRAKQRPSGHNITPKFQRDNGGAIPPNLLELGNNDANSAYMEGCKRIGIKPHPARFPRGIPEFFIKLCTREGDRVLDPFAGSNVTGEAAELLGRQWLAMEIREDYLKGAGLRFQQPAIWESPIMYDETL